MSLWRLTEWTLEKAVDAAFNQVSKPGKTIDQRIEELDRTLEALGNQEQAEAPVGRPEPPPHQVPRPPEAVQATTGILLLPTTEETIAELHDDLVKELLRMERDLAHGARIAGKPCDCLGKKHSLGLEAMCEELMAMETKPVYNNIIVWLRAHVEEFDQAGIAERPREYYQSLIPDVRRFRKDVMGAAVSLP